MAAWMVLATAVIAAKSHLPRRLAKVGEFARRVGPGRRLRTVAKSVYALATFVLIARGWGGERFFAFALRSASMLTCSVANDGLEVERMLAAVHYHEHPPMDWAAHDESRAKVLSEWKKLDAYRKSGFIAPWPGG